MASVSPADSGPFGSPAANSPSAGFAPSTSAAMNGSPLLSTPPPYDGAANQALFASKLAVAVPEPYATEYAATLAQQCISVTNPPQLSPAEFAELGVRIGHRDAVATVLATLRSDRAESAFDLQQPTITAGLVVEADEDMTDPMAESRMKTEVIKLADHGRWIDVSGTDSSFKAFKVTIAESLKRAKLPTAFLPLFTLKNPSPFWIAMPNANGTVAFGMLLRVTCLNLVEYANNVSDNAAALSVMRGGECTLADMTNRLVVIYQAPTGSSRGRLYTFRKDGMPWLDELRDSLQKNVDNSSTTSIEVVASKLIRSNMEGFREALQALQHELEIVTVLPDGYRPLDVVKTLSRLQRQTAVVQRCINGNERVIRAASNEEAFKVDTKHLLVALDDIKGAAEEIEQNAEQVFNLRLAMIDFKGQMHMRIFTNMTVIVAPISVITGWFGMNFEDMPELKIAGFYYGLVAFVLTVILGLALFLAYINRDRYVSSAVANEAELVLTKASGNEDD